MPANRRRLAAVAGPAVAELDTLHGAVWELAPDPVILELCRLRVAALLGADEAARWRSPIAVGAGLDEAKVATLEEWHVSPYFDARERAYLDFTEQFVTSVKHVSDAQIASLCAHDSEVNVCAFVSALYVLELTQRVALVSASVLRPEEEIAA